jgi:hypothetical protein
MGCFLSDGSAALDIGGLRRTNPPPLTIPSESIGRDGHHPPPSCPSLAILVSYLYEIFGLLQLPLADSCVQASRPISYRNQ